MRCPKCGSDDLYDRWTNNRMLQRGCRECTWKEKPRIPELRVIKNTKLILANQFSGFCYEVYDKYGHALCYSRSYRTKEEAKEELLKELARDNKSPHQGPCTGILWPDKVEVIGEVVKEGDE